jgi:hypothetical protein
MIGFFGSASASSESTIDEDSLSTGNAWTSASDVTMCGTVTDFPAVDYVFAGLSYRKKGTMSGSYGEEIKLWNPRVRPSNADKSDQHGNTFELTFEFGNEGVTRESEEWRLLPGNTYTYHASIRIPRRIGFKTISGEEREFVIPQSRE